MGETREPREIVNTALLCAEGEAAIEGYEERAAREWLAALEAERDRLRGEVADREKDLQAVSEAAYAITEKYRKLRGENAALRAVIDAARAYRETYANTMRSGQEQVRAQIALFDAVDTLDAPPAGRGGGE
jgi:chromosome segregation ATPase